MTSVRGIVAAIEQRLSEVRLGLADARAVLDEVAAEEAALAKALRALAPESALLPKPPQAKPAPPPPKRKRPAHKQVSDALLDRVRFTIDQAIAPVTLAEIAVAADVTKSAANLAVTVLRERQQVRMAGRSPGRGKPGLYATMNGADA